MEPQRTSAHSYPSGILRYLWCEHKSQWWLHGRFWGSKPMRNEMSRNSPPERNSGAATDNWWPKLKKNDVSVRLLIWTTEILAPEFQKPSEMWFDWGKPSILNKSVEFVGPLLQIWDKTIIRVTSIEWNRYSQPLRSSAT